MSILKKIALDYNDKELYKLASELEKEAVTNPMQMAIQKNIATQNPMQGLHYDRLTTLAGQAKAGVPGALDKMRQASSALKRGGVIRLDDATKIGLKAALNKPTQFAKIAPLVPKSKSMIGTLIKAVK